MTRTVESPNRRLIPSVRLSCRRLFPSGPFSVRVGVRSESAAHMDIGPGSSAPENSRSGPSRHREAGNPLEVGQVVGHQRRGQSQGMRRDQKVHGADRLAGSFQFVPDPAVSTAINPVIPARAGRARGSRTRRRVSRRLLKEDLPRVPGDDEEPFAGALEVERIRLDAKLFR